MILVVTFFAVACGNSESDKKQGTNADVTQSQSSSKEKIVLGINDWPGSYWWLAVKELGYFEEQGVDVTVQLFSNYADGLSALNSGSIDMFVPALADIIPAYVSGADIKVIMVQDFSAGADGVIASDDITEVEDLRGKDIAIELGGSDHLLLLKCLEYAGLSLEDVNITNMSTGDAANAFISGKVDAAAVWEPSLSMAQQETGGNILATSADEEYEGLIPAVLAVNGNSLSAKREEMKLVMKAWYNARDSYENNFDAFAEAVSHSSEVTPEEFETLMKGCDVRTIEENEAAFADGDTYISLINCAEMLGGFLYDNELIDNQPESYEALFDRSLFDEVKQELK